MNNWRTNLGALTVGAALVGVGCAGTNDATAVRAQERTVDRPVARLVEGVSEQDRSSPVLVNCRPPLRALVRQTTFEGRPVTEVDCVAAEAPVYTQQPAPYAAPTPTGWTNPAWSEPAPVRFVPVAAPVAAAPAAPPVREVRERVVYREGAPQREVQRGRSWKKSALIIGSSAGIGAGVGAAVGGKKGALIGAAIGGGGATIWDQTTRK